MLPGFEDDALGSTAVFIVDTMAPSVAITTRPSAAPNIIPSPVAAQTSLPAARDITKRLEQGSWRGDRWLFRILNIGGNGQTTNDE